MAKEKVEERDPLEVALESLNKSIGEGTVYKYKDFKGTSEERVTTGSIGLDYITGGGWPKGRINYLVGWESSGKSTICLYATREFQKLGGTVLYVDSEQSYSKNYAESLGVDVDELIISQPDCMEDGYNVVERLVATGKIDLVIFDSVAAAQTRKQLEGDIGDSELGVKAKLNSQAMPKFLALFRKHNTTGLWVNQYREKIGVMFGSPITEPASNAVKYAASIKLEVSKSTKIMDGAETIGNLFKANCTKNKTSPPYRTAEYNIEYGMGFDREHEIFTWGQFTDVISRAGSHYSYGNIKIGNGVLAAMTMLKDNPELCDELEANIRTVMFG
jgi:recombination protein RecA